MYLLMCLASAAHDVVPYGHVLTTLSGRTEVPILHYTVIQSDAYATCGCCDPPAQLRGG